MGGDHGPSVVVPAALHALQQHPSLSLIVVGHEAVLQEQLDKTSSKYSVDILARLRIHHASENVLMDELPSHAMRYKKDSSMRVALNLVKEKQAMACVSAGNTGALMATARFVLKTLPGIERPAIIAEIPTLNGSVRMLDLGANVDSCAEHLCQFAILGSLLASAVDKIERPKVGLMNIGVEEIKGNDQVKRTAHLLSEIKSINYIGYVEGDDIFKDVADVVVCDGFVGNVALKTIEGAVRLTGNLLKLEYQRNWWTRSLAILSTSLIKRVKKRIDPSRYNGATMIGLNGIVIKSHGGASQLGFYNAIVEAMKQVQTNVPQLIIEQVSQILDHGEIE